MEDKGFIWKQDIRHLRNITPSYKKKEHRNELILGMKILIFLKNVEDYNLKGS